MSLYLYILRFRFLRFLNYPVEIIADILKRAVEITIVIYLWTLIFKSSSNGLTAQQTISYFLIAVGVGEIVMAKWGAFARLIANNIRDGTLSNYLIKPTPILPTLYFTGLGSIGVRVLVAFFSVIAGIIINPPETLFAFLMFLIFLLAAFAVAFAYNLFLGTMYFHIGEASGVKNSIEHMSRILSGAMVPLAYFPKSAAFLVKLLPFQVMVYGPTNALTINSINTDVIYSIVIAFFWAISLNIAAFMFWRRSIKNYEASGI